MDNIGVTPTQIPLSCEKQRNTLKNQSLLLSAQIRNVDCFGSDKYRNTVLSLYGLPFSSFLLQLIRPTHIWRVVSVCLGKEEFPI